RTIQEYFSLASLLFTLVAHIFLYCIFFDSLLLWFHFNRGRTEHERVNRHHSARAERQERTNRQHDPAHPGGAVVYRRVRRTVLAGSAGSDASADARRHPTGHRRD